MSPLFPKVGIHDGVTLIMVITLLATGFHNFADDPGVGWHLATGRFIAENFQVPDYDPFLAADKVRSWICDQWLADLLMYKLFQYGGWPLLYMTFGLLYLLTFSLVLYRGVAAISGSLLGGSLAALIAFKAGEIHLLLRPSMFGFLLFATMLLLLQSAVLELRREDRRVAPLLGVLLALPPLFTLWANLHPSFPLGLIALLLAPLALLLDYATFGHRFAAKHFIYLCVLFAAAFAATLLNPNGLNLHRSILSLGGSDYFMNLHVEWLGPDFKVLEGELIVLIGALLLLSLFLSGPLRLGWRWFELLLVAVFMYGALRAVRVLPYFAIASAVPLVSALRNLKHARVFGRDGPMRMLRRRIETLEAREGATARGLLVLFLATLLICGDFLQNRTLPLFSGPFGPTPAKFPYGAVEQLLQAGGGAVTVLAPPNWGGFITWKGAGQVRAIIDDRNSLLGEAHYRRVDRALHFPADLRQLVIDTGASHVLLPARLPLTQFLLEQQYGTVVYRDDVAVLWSQL